MLLQLVHPSYCVFDQLIDLPGVGDYTAKAILGIGYNKSLMSKLRCSVLTIKYILECKINKMMLVFCFSDKLSG